LVSPFRFTEEAIPLAVDGRGGIKGCGAWDGAAAFRFTASCAAL